MKKNLLHLLFAILALNVGYAQQSKQNNYSATSANSNYSNASALKTIASQAVITTTTSTCMSINLPAPATWSLVNYGAGTPYATSGFVSGQNIYADKEKAMYFDVSASSNSSVTHVYVAFNHAYSATPSKVVTLKLYDGTTTNVIGTQLVGVATLTMGTIMSDVAANQYSDFLFATPIALPASKKFYASVDISTLVWTSTVKDSISIVSNTDPQSTPSPAWEKQSTNTWYNYPSASSWSLNISLLIHPFLIQSPVISNFTVSSNTICTTQSTNYNSAGSTTGGSFYWSFGAIPTSTSSLATPAPSYPSAGTFTTYLLVYDACGSYAVSSKTVLVKSTPNVSANPSATNVCNGANVTLAGGGASTYAWTGGITNNTAFTATSSVNYTVSGTAANGCTNTAVSSVIISQNPTVTINSSTTSVCSGNSITLSGAGAVSYAWTGSVPNAAPFTPTSSGTYTVTGTQGICTGTAAITIPVNPSPTVTANTSTSTVCAGNNITLTGNGATSYTWTGGAVNALPFSPAATATFIVTGLSGGCTGTAAVAIVVNSPVVVANANPTVVCTGNNLTLTGSGATTYTWANGVTNAAPFTPTGTASYTVSGTDANGCVATGTVNVVVSVCTGLSGNGLSNETIRLYPNPNSGNFIIERNGFLQEAVITIFDTVGKLVYSQKLNNAVNSIQANLSAGMYSVRITEGSSLKIIHKLIIN